ncbi:Rha family transcriptional regulator [Butyricicoccus pullicaecorum]|uniref:Rha family phage regulatory protein n=1 Tax=Butyricicoccus pullicaecorum 1.2 TaxID=1203606 RepID=R8W3U8_9FIRM|nr:Rha family transcriptional regulator [Butyricicoccus pullicaecorum]EOQ39610.1 hypothetical protein HMPREF1526_00304 [Butyricicoccus pullicaecorum 1.2]SKA56761.1 Phage regulatory protein Rha [Butyricicoccus pullicaecorum DSM 23266]
MNHLVFLTPNTQEPFTTSDVIAAFAGIQHHTVTRLIQQHEADFKEFGILRFEIEEIKGRGQPAKRYQLNEEQATLLMTYLKNTAQVRAFKKELVRQFYAMRFELYKVQAAKMERRPVRVSMTDAIKALPDSPHKAMKYGQYTDLAYKLALGRTARQLRKDRGADKHAVASDYMTAEEISLVSDVENKIGVLIGIGMGYQEIKAKLTRRIM